MPSWCALRKAAFVNRSADRPCSSSSERISLTQQSRTRRAWAAARRGVIGHLRGPATERRQRQLRVVRSTPDQRRRLQIRAGVPLRGTCAASATSCAPSPPVKGCQKLSSEGGPADPVKACPTVLLQPLRAPAAASEPTAPRNPLLPCMRTTVQRWNQHGATGQRAARGARPAGVPTLYSGRNLASTHRTDHSARGRARSAATAVRIRSIRAGQVDGSGTTGRPEGSGERRGRDSRTSPRARASPSRRSPTS